MRAHVCRCVCVFHTSSAPMHMCVGVCVCIDLAS